jgi:hypothetical protein
LNPYKLNELHSGERIIYDAVDPIDFDNYESAKAVRKGTFFPNQAPIALGPCGPILESACSPVALPFMMMRGHWRRQSILE